MNLNDLLKLIFKYILNWNFLIDLYLTVNEYETELTRERSWEARVASYASSEVWSGLYIYKQVGKYGR